MEGRVRDGAGVALAALLEASSGRAARCGSQAGCRSSLLELLARCARTVPSRGFAAAGLACALAFAVAPCEARSTNRPDDIGPPPAPVEFPQVTVIGSKPGGWYD